MYRRKDFIKVAALGSISLYLEACNFGSKKPTEVVPDEKQAPPVKALEPAITFAMYKQGDAAYDTLRQGFNKRIDRKPKAIALCKNTEDVSSAIKYAAYHKLPVAIKSGGHCMEGFSANDDGLVVNLSELNKVEWLDENTIKVGPGCKLGQLYNELLPKGKFLPAGSCAGVGVGGLTLGGGYGIFSRACGLTCDSLQDVTMVDAKGNVIHGKGDKELMWACRGGGSGNYGVITELIFKVHDAPATLQSHRFKAYKLDAAKAEALLEKWFALTADLPDTCFSAFVLNGKTLNILLTDTVENNDTTKDVIEAFTAMVEKVSLGQPKPLAVAVKNYYGIQTPIYFKNASSGLYKSFSDVKPAIGSVLEIVTSTPGMIYQVNTLGGKIGNAVAEENAAYPHRAYTYLSELQTYWEQPSQADKLLQRFEEVQHLFKAAGINTQYRNYPDINFSDWQHAYYGDNYKRLQAVKAKYDPDNLIRHAQSVQADKA